MRAMISVLFFFSVFVSVIFSQDVGATHKDLKSVLSKAATRPWETAETYLDALFILSYLLKNPVHGYVVAGPKESEFIATLMGNLGVAIKNNLSVVYVVGDKCLKDGELEYSEEFEKLLEKELSDIKTKYNIALTYRVPEGTDAKAEFKDYLIRLRQIFHRQSRHNADTRKYKQGDSLSDSDVMYLIQLVAVSLDQLKLIITDDKAIDEVSNLLCGEIKKYVEVVGVGPVYFGPELFKLRMDKLRGSSAYLLSVPLQAIVLGYTVLSSRLYT